MSAPAFWCEDCSPDNCCGCSAPPVLGSVVRVGGHAAHRSHDGRGGTYLGEVVRVTDCLGLKPDTVGVQLAGHTDPLPTDYPISSLYPCVPPSEEYVAGLRRRAENRRQDWLDKMAVREAAIAPVPA